MFTTEFTKSKYIQMCACYRILVPGIQSLRGDSNNLLNMSDCNHLRIGGDAELS